MRCCMDIREIAKRVVASAFDEDTMPAGGMAVRLPEDDAERMGSCGHRSHARV